MFRVSFVKRFLLIEVIVRHLQFELHVLSKEKKEFFFIEKVLKTRVF